MKFNCDRCKTRYSIGEDRVRGKILKIRCKNCANVITVREGMDSEQGAAPAQRPRQPTSNVPLGGPSAPPPAPPDLGEEWYVSIDGVQTGPLSLQEAQRWVAAKPFEAELHCWNEGFEDWLPVDKVSHFRNLRKPRAPSKTAPPPIPEKPLFAATMAALEKGPTGSQPSLPSRGAARIGVPVIPAVKPVAASGPVPQTAKGSTPSPIAARTSSSSTRIPAVQSVAPKRAGAAALAAAFETEDVATDVDAPPLKDEVATRAEAVAAQRSRGHGFDFGGPASAPSIASPPLASQRPVGDTLDSDDDDSLSIGEVSRVVKLADLAPKPQAAAAPRMRSNTGSAPRIGAGTGTAARIGGSTAAVQRISSPVLTGTQPRLSPSELGMNVDPALAAATALGGPSAHESLVARSFAQRHRRGMLALIAISVVLVASVVGVVVFVGSKGTDEEAGGFGGMKQIDTSRPEDIVIKQVAVVQAGSGSAAPLQPIKPKPSRPNVTTNNQVQPQEDPTGNALRASEIEDMAAKQNEGTKRCYMRAQKGALGFEIADIKKIAVTLTVNKDGGVTDVQLSSNSNDSFGQCLIARIKAWRFRSSSSGGTFRISLAFSS